MKIAYCTWTDPYDKQSWSGIHYILRVYLEKYCGEVISVGPLKNKYFFWGKLLNKIMQLVFKKNFTFHHATIIAKEFSRQLSEKLNKLDVDILFFAGGSGLIAFLETEIPIVYLTDSTYDSMIDYYQNYSNILPISKKMGNKLEREALNKSSLIIFTSHWAKEAAIKSYNCSLEKIAVINLGANIENTPERKEILKQRKARFTICTLLLVGVNWDRKGGQLAFDTMRLLNEKGIKTELIVCGCTPPKNIKHEHLKVVGYLNKNNPDDLEKLKQLYYNANIFILPTRSECAGIVFCEASAYGLPIISTDTGGVSSYVNDSNNGYVLPLDSAADQYADAIEAILADQDRYFDFAVASRDRYEKELNWDICGQQIKGSLKNLLNKNRYTKPGDVLNSTKPNHFDSNNNIFLISQPRSGSTLFQKLLHNHQDIATTGETWALLPILFGNVLNNIRLSNNLAFDGQLSEKAIRHSLSELSNPNEVIKEAFLNAYSIICTKHSNEQNAKYFLDKTPRYYYIIDEIIKRFESAKILILLRNPLSVLSSILNTWIKKDYFLLTNYKDDLLLAPKILAETLKKNHTNIYPVYYEQLIDDPSNQLKNICNFLNIDFNEALLKPDSEKKWFFGDQTKIYEHNKILKNDQKLNLIIKSRQDWRLHSDYLDFLGPDLMKSLGYDFAEHRLMLDEMKPKYSFTFGLKFYTSNLLKSVGKLTTQKRLLKNNISNIYKQN